MKSLFGTNKERTQKNRSPIVGKQRTVSIQMPHLLVVQTKSLMCRCEFDHKDLLTMSMCLVPTAAYCLGTCSVFYACMCTFFDVYQQSRDRHKNNKNPVKINCDNAKRKIKKNEEGNECGLLCLPVSVHEMS